MAQRIEIGINIGLPYDHENGSNGSKMELGEDEIRRILSGCIGVTSPDSKLVEALLRNEELFPHINYNDEDYEKGDIFVFGPAGYLLPSFHLAVFLGRDKEGKPQLEHFTERGGLCIWGLEMFSAFPEYEKLLEVRKVKDSKQYDYYTRQD